MHHFTGLFDCSFFTLMAAFSTYDTMVSSLGLVGPDHFMCDFIFIHQLSLAQGNGSVYSSYDEDAMTEGNLGRRTCKGGLRSIMEPPTIFFCTRSEDEGSKAAKTKVERPRKAPRWGAGGWEGQVSWPRGD